MLLPLILLASVPTPEQLLENPKSARLILSTAVCSARQDEQEALDAIKETKDESKIAGVVDLRELKRLQDQVVFHRARIKVLRGWMTEAKVKPLSCDGDAVTGFWECWSDLEKPGVCQEPAVRQALRVLEQLEEHTKQVVWGND